MQPTLTKRSRFSVTAPPSSHRCAGQLVSPCDACEVRDFASCAPLNPDEQKRLVSVMTTIEVGPHEPIFDEADPADYVFNVTGGAVKIYKLLPDGRRQITGFLMPGDFLGLTHKDAYAYSAEALVPTKLCRLPRRKLEGLLDEMPKLEQRLLGMASHELAAAQDQMMLLGRKSAKERVVSFLLMMSAAAVRRGKPGDPVGLPMNRSDIADYLGLTIETVSRTFTQLRTQKLIELMDEKQVRLLKPEALREIATGF
jgi:CRP/FNR family transcriptional regulator, anaerobic regulatory protein